MADEQTPDWGAHKDRIFTVPDEPASIAVYMKPDEQAIAMFVGGGTVHIARDHQDADWDFTDTQRAVLIARLRAIADHIERTQEPTC